MAAATAQAGMHNTEGINVDLYIPRKWCALPACGDRFAGASAAAVRLRESKVLL